MSVSGGSVTEATISSLMSFTTYSIQVAAVNSAGIGLYSSPIHQLTSGKTGGKVVALELNNAVTISLSSQLVLHL